MELTTAEEAHVVCLFPGLEEAGAFSALVREKLPPIPNNPAVFGPQLYLDEKDRPPGRPPSASTRRPPWSAPTAA